MNTTPSKCFIRSALLCSVGLLMAGHAAAATLQLTPIGTHVNGPPFNSSAAEIVAHDRKSQRLYVVNALGVRIDVLDIQNPALPTKIGVIDLLPYGAVVNSVAVDGALIAVAVEAAVKTDPGSVVFFNRELEHKNTVLVGALPDMLTFSPDGRWVLVANEGEPNTYNNFGSETNGPSIDPEGSVSIIDLKKGVTKATVRTATFTKFNDTVLDPSIRISDPAQPVMLDYVNNRNFSNPFDFATTEDLGPEGLTFIEAADSPNGKPLLVIANEISGTTTIFQLNKL